MAVRTTRGVAAREATAASRGGRMPTGATIVPERPASTESMAVSIAGSVVSYNSNHRNLHNRNCCALTCHTLCIFKCFRYTAILRIYSRHLKNLYNSY